MFALRRLFTHYYVILRACFDFIIVEQIGLRKNTE